MRKAPWKGLEHPQSLVFAGGLGMTVFIEYLLLVSPLHSAASPHYHPFYRQRNQDLGN